MDEMLREIYKESNAHLRASDNKRDQIIAFYLIITGFLFGSLDKLNDLGLLSCASMIIGIAGIIIALIIMTYSKWHKIYRKTAIVVQYLAINKKRPTEYNIKKAWTKLANKSIVTQKEHQIIGTEWLMYNLFLFIAFTPFYLIMYNWDSIIVHLFHLHKSNLWMIIPHILFVLKSCSWMITIHLSYIVVMNLVSCQYLKWSNLDEPNCSWLLRLHISCSEE